MNDDKLQFEGEGNPLIKFQTAEIITSLRKGHLYAKTLKKQVTIKLVINSKGNFI